MRTPLRNDCAALLRSLLEELCSNRRLVAVGSSGWRRAAIGRGSWLASPCRQDNGGEMCSGRGSQGEIWGGGRGVEIGGGGRNRAEVVEEVEIGGGRRNRGGKVEEVEIEEEGRRQRLN